MPLVELEESELQRLRQQEKLLQTMGADPRTRKKALEIIQELSGGRVAIPELQTEKSVEEKFSAIEKRLADAEAARRKEAEEAKTKEALRGIEGSIQEGRKKLRDLKYTDDGIAAVEKLMEERGLADYDAAEALFSKMQPKDAPVDPASYGSRSWDFTRPQETDADHKALLANPDSWAHGMAAKVMNEFRGQRH